MRFIYPYFFICFVCMSTLAWGNEIVPIQSQSQVHQICLALQNKDIAYKNEPLDLGALRRHAEEQEKIKNSDFLLEMEWKSFVITEFDTDNNQVTLSTERPFKTLDGKLILFDSGRDEIALQFLPNQIENFQKGIKAQNLTLAVLFRPAEAQKYPCTIDSSKTLTFSADLMGAEIRFQGQPVAQATEEGFEPIPSSTGIPSVAVRLASLETHSSGKSEISVGTPPEKSTSDSASHRPLLQCYQEALQRDPTLRGSLVVSVTHQPTVIAETLNNDQLVDCSKKAVSQLPQKNQTVVVEFQRR